MPSSSKTAVEPKVLIMLQELIILKVLGERGDVANVCDLSVRGRIQRKKARWACTAATSDLDGPDQMCGLGPGGCAIGFAGSGVIVYDAVIWAVSSRAWI